MTIDPMALYMNWPTGGSAEGTTPLTEQNTGGTNTGTGGANTGTQIGTNGTGTNGTNNGNTNTNVTLQPMSQHEIDNLFALIDQEALGTQNDYQVVKGALPGKIQSAQNQFNQEADAAEARRNAGLATAVAATEAAFNSWLTTTANKRAIAKNKFETDETTRTNRRLSEDTNTEADFESAVETALNLFDAEIAAAEADFLSAEEVSQAAYEAAIAAAQATYDGVAASLLTTYQSTTTTADNDYETTATSAQTTYTAAETAAMASLQTTNASVNSTLQSSLSTAETTLQSSLSGLGNPVYDTSFLSDLDFQDDANALVSSAQGSVNTALDVLTGAITAATLRRDVAIATATAARQADIVRLRDEHAAAVTAATSRRDTSISDAQTALSDTRNTLAAAYEGTVATAGGDLELSLNTALSVYQTSVDGALTAFDITVRTANDDYNSWATTRFGEDPTIDPSTGAVIPSSGGTYQDDVDTLIDAAALAVSDAKDDYNLAMDLLNDRTRGAVDVAVAAYMTDMFPKSWEDPQYTEIWRVAEAQANLAFQIYENLQDQGLLQRTLITIHNTFMQGWIRDEQKLVEDDLKSKETLINKLLELKMSELETKTSIGLVYANAVSSALTDLTNGILALEATAATEATTRAAAVDTVAAGAEATYVKAKASAQKRYDDDVATARKGFRETIATAQKSRTDGEATAVKDYQLALDAAEEAFTNDVDDADSTWVADNSDSVETYQDDLQAAADDWDADVTSAEDTAWSDIESAVGTFVSSANSLYSSALVAANPGVTDISDVADAFAAYNDDTADAILAAGADSIDAIHSYNATVGDAADTFGDTMLTAGVTLVSTYSSAATDYITGEAGAWKSAADDAANALEDRILDSVNNAKTAFDRSSDAAFNATKSITAETKRRVERLAESAKTDAQAEVANVRDKFNSDVTETKTELTETLSGISVAFSTQSGFEVTEQREQIDAYLLMMSNLIKDVKEARIAETKASLAAMRKSFRDELVSAMAALSAGSWVTGITAVGAVTGLPGTSVITGIAGMTGMAGGVTSWVDVANRVVPTLSYHSFDPQFGNAELDGMLNPPPEPTPDPPPGWTPPPPPPPMPSPLAQAFEMGWEAAKGWNVGYGHGVQITTNTFTFGMIKPLNESTQQLINENQHLGYKYAEGAAAVSRTALVTAGTLGIGQAAQAAQAAQCVAGVATTAGRAAQLYNGAMAAYQGYQGCKASREAYDRISKRDYIGGYMKVGEAALNFFGAAQSGRMAVKGPQCFVTGTQVVVQGDDGALPPGNIIAAEAQNQAIVASTGESELAAVAVIGVGIALGIAKSQLADEGRSSDSSKRLFMKTRPQQNGPRPTDLPDEPRKVYDHNPDPIRVVMPSKPRPIMAQTEVPKPKAANSKTMKPKRHSLSKTLTAAMLFCFALGGWFVSQSALRTSDQAQASSSAASSLPTEPRYVTKNIEDIEEGDVVLARDENGDEIGWRRVVEVYHSRSDHIRHLRFRDEQGQVQSISTTDEHPFWVAAFNKFINAGDLAEYAKVTGPNGEIQTLISSTRTEHPEGIPVFNFQVEGTHTYYVAQQSGDKPILVHNTSALGIVCGAGAATPQTPFGSKEYGNAVHSDFGKVAQKMTGQKALIDRTAPGKTGVDLTFKDPIKSLQDGTPTLPFRHAELKPITGAGADQFFRQNERWRWGIGNNNPHIAPGEGVGLFGYDANGKISFFGVFY